MLGFGVKETRLLQALRGGAVYNAARGLLEPRPRGGAYQDLKVARSWERHHMPADSESPLSTGKGPAITMRSLDHLLLPSTGSSAYAQMFRALQSELILDGQIEVAQDLEVAEIRAFFGTRYDSAILEMQWNTAVLRARGEL